MKKTATIKWLFEQKNTNSNTAVKDHYGDNPETLA